MKNIKIIARKPAELAGHGIERIVVDRGPGHVMPFVSATADPHSLANGEWYWGHYFQTEAEALAHFNGRS